MKEQLVSFKTAKLAKKKGFKGLFPTTDYIPMYVEDENTHIGILKEKQGEDDCRDDFYLAPTQSLLQKWLREVHNIDVVLSPERYSNGINYLVQAQKWDLNADPEVNPNFVIKGSYWFNDNHEYGTYEEALEKGLQEALKLI